MRRTVIALLRTSTIVVLALTVTPHAVPAQKQDEAQRRIRCRRRTGRSAAAAAATAGGEQQKRDERAAYGAHILHRDSPRGVPHARLF